MSKIIRKVRLSRPKAHNQQSISITSPQPAGSVAAVKISPTRLPVAILREMVRRQRSRLEAVGRISRTLAESTSLTQLYERLSRSVFDLFPESSHLYVFRTEEGSSIQFIHAVQNGRLSGQPWGSDLIPALMPPPSANGLQSEVVSSQRPLIINDLPHYAAKTRIVPERASAPFANSVLLAPMVANQKVMGVLEVLSEMRQRYNTLDADLLSLVANTTALAIQNQYLQHDLAVAQRSLATGYEKTVESWRRALELRDRITETHAVRVAELTVRLGVQLGISQRELVFLKFGAVLHDIGKIGVPDRVLLKAGPLDDDDFRIMRKHPEYALEMLGAIPNFSPVLEIPYYHHEKWDGTGYPHGLSGEQIPLPARIFAVIDVYDALCSDRPYRPAWHKEEALEYIRHESGHHFDPQVVTAFLALLLSAARHSQPA